MKHRHAFLHLFIAFSFILSTMRTSVFSQSRGMNYVETENISNADQKGQFIAAFNWSVDGGRDYVWPFESMRPAPYDMVWMIVETMPRVLPEKSPGKQSIAFPANRLLRVNGRSLPRPHLGPGSVEEFRVPLERGRLRLSFSVPSGYRLDPRFTMIRVRLHKVD